MPTVLAVDGFKFLFYSDEGNERCHIHVKKSGGDGKIWLLPETKEEYFYGFTVGEVRKIRKLIEEHRDELINEWNEYFR